MSNPLDFRVFYLVKYYGGFIYFIPHAMKNQLKNTATLIITTHTPLFLLAGSGLMLHTAKTSPLVILLGLLAQSLIVHPKPFHKWYSNIFIVSFHY
jgi:hypothetical protein